MNTGSDWSFKSATEFTFVNVSIIDHFETMIFFNPTNLQKIQLSNYKQTKFNNVILSKFTSKISNFIS